MQPAIAAPFTTSVTPHNNEFIPLAPSVESSEIRQPMRRGPRTSSVFSRIQSLSRRREVTSSTRADSTSSQHPERPHATQAAASPTYLSRHQSALNCITDAGTGSADRTYRYRKCRTCVVRSTSGAHLLLSPRGRPSQCEQPLR